MPTIKSATAVTPVLVGENASSGTSGQSSLSASTSELTAINTMLSAIGEMPVSSLSSSTATPAVIMAQNILKEIHREVDNMGWHYNTEPDVEFTFDDAGDINVPVSVIRLDVQVGNYPTKDIVLRNSRLYDLKGHTYTFTENIKVDAVYHMEWEELPETARRYITIRAARILQDRIIGDQTQNAFNSRDEYSALVGLKEFEGDTAAYTMLQAPDVAKTIFVGPLSRVSHR